MDFIFMEWSPWTRVLISDYILKGGKVIVMRKIMSFLLRNKLRRCMVCHWTNFEETRPSGLSLGVYKTRKPGQWCMKWQTGVAEYNPFLLEINWNQAYIGAEFIWLKPEK